MTGVIVQLSDLHVQVGEDAAACEQRLAGAIDLVRRIERPIAAILLTGDIADSGSVEEHDRALELLAPLLELGAPVLPVVGNHDDRPALRATFAGAASVPDLGEERHLQYVVDLDELRVVVLDTQHTGHDDGKLCDTRHAWLERQLSAAPDVPTILAMHHPPVPVGLPRFDAIGLREDHAVRLEQLVAANPQVVLVACGHVHRPYASLLAHAPVFGCPSVFWPAEPDLLGEHPIRLVDGPIGVGVHVPTTATGLASHVRMIGDVPTERRPASRGS